MPDTAGLVAQYHYASGELDRRAVEEVTYIHLANDDRVVHRWHSMSCACPGCRVTDFAAVQHYQNVDYESLGRFR